MARKAYAINVNGDFEGGTVDPWIAGTGGTLSLVDTPPGATWTGTKSMQVTPDGVTNAIAVNSEAIAVKPGRVVTLTAQARSTATTNVAFPRAQWYDASSAFISVTGPAYANITANTWTNRLSGSLTAPENAAFLRINFGLGGTPTAPVVFDECWVNATYALTCSAVASPTGGDWNVKLTLSTDALATEYGSYRIQRDGVNQAFVSGTLPATWSGTQPAGTTSTWSVQLMKDVSNPTTQIVAIANASSQVTTASSSGQSLVTDYDGSVYAWCEIQSWPELRYTRRSATMQIMGSSNPVVTNDVALMAASTPVFATLTTADRDALAHVLSQAGPLRLQPYCTALDDPWFMPLDFNQVRRLNKASDGTWLTEANIQHIDTPAVVGAAAREASLAVEAEEPETTA